VAELRAAAAALDAESTESKTAFMTKSLPVLAEALARAIADKKYEGVLSLADELTSTVLPAKNPDRTPKSVKRPQVSLTRACGAGRRARAARAAGPAPPGESVKSAATTQSQSGMGPRYDTSILHRKTRATPPASNNAMRRRPRRSCGLHLLDSNKNCTGLAQIVGQL
jgi:hypothetical protein